MATNERNGSRLESVIDKASQHARMIYYLYLGFIAYCAVTVFSTTDRQLALKGDKAQLPILDIAVPLDGFFIFAPVLAIGLFVYFMLYLHRLNSLIDDLMEADPSYNKRDLYPWMINIARELEQGYGVIVNNSSVGGLKAIPGVAAYIASKGAVTQLTRSMALEYADKGIRVNAICPGAIETPMVTDDFLGNVEDREAAEQHLLSLHPMGRLGTPEEIAHSILFLVDDNIGFMTGNMLSVDGGWIAR